MLKTSTLFLVINETNTQKINKDAEDLNNISPIWLKCIYTKLHLTIVYNTLHNTFFSSGHSPRDHIPDYKIHLSKPNITETIQSLYCDSFTNECLFGYLLGFWYTLMMTLIFSSVQSLSHVQLFATPWIVAL